VTVQPIDTAYLYPRILDLFAYAGFRYDLIIGSEFIPYVLYRRFAKRLLSRGLAEWDQILGTLLPSRLAYRLTIIARAL
jgi:hypothetical protein